MRKLAYGPLRLKPHEFWDLSLDEWNCLVEGEIQRERRERQWAASDVCAVIAGYRAKRLDVKKLYRQLTLPEDKPDYKKGVMGKILKASNKRAKDGR